MEHGQVAVLFVARNATVDRVIEAIKPYDPKVIQTNLSWGCEREPIEALEGQPVSRRPVVRTGGC
mgnify:CR=1 FL=1